MAKKIPIVERILGANQELAEENKIRLDAANVFSINLMASPGAGKTSLIENTIPVMADQFQVAVVDGDIATTIDADRAQAAGATAVQINTGGECHLDSVMVSQALNELDLDATDLLVIENVGNLICPVSFPLGTDLNILIASVPEGDDKPYKYPGIYQGVDILVINKIDLLPYVDFNMAYFKNGVEMLNPGLVTFPLSCRTGEGVNQWVEWLTKRIREKIRN